MFQRPQPDPRLSRALLATAVAALLLVAGAVAGLTSSATGDVEIAGSSEVLQGSSVALNVTFGAGEEHETVTVACQEPGCTVWERHVTLDEEAPHCEVQDNRRICEIGFPHGFTAVDDAASTAEEAGAPAHAATYEVRVDSFEEPARFDAHLSTAGMCGDVYERGQVLNISTSGHAAGTDVDVRLAQGDSLVLERSVTSEDPAIADRFRWQIPLNQSLDPAQFHLTVEAGEDTEHASFTLAPATAEPHFFREPGQGAPEAYERGEPIRMMVAYAFPTSPGCAEPALEKGLRLASEDQVPDRAFGDVVKRQDRLGFHDSSQRVAQVEGERVPHGHGLRFAYEVREDAERTSDGTVGERSPVYELHVDPIETDDGNYLGSAVGEAYHVVPYRTLPGPAPALN